MAKHLFNGAGMSGVTAPCTLKTINKNANRGDNVEAKAIRCYAGRPRPMGGSKAAAVGQYARGIRSVGDGAAVQEAKVLTRGVPSREPPMGPGPVYNPAATKDPEYHGSVQTTAPAATHDAHPSTSVKMKGY